MDSWPLVISFHSLRTSKESEANGSTENLISPKPITSVVTERKEKAYELRKHTLKSQYKEAVETPRFEFYVHLKGKKKKLKPEILISVSLPNLKFIANVFLPYA